mgnify:CR=1 FL=1
MESTRQQKVAKLIQKELSEIFRQEGQNYSPSAILTVTRVDIAKDLSFAKVYVSIFATGDKKLVFETIEHNKKEIRFKLGQKIKNQMRIIPELAFVFDDTLDYIENIDKLLKQ